MRSNRRCDLEHAFASPRTKIYCEPGARPTAAARLRGRRPVGTARQMAPAGPSCRQGAAGLAGMKAASSISMPPLQIYPAPTSGICQHTCRTLHSADQASANRSFSWRLVVTFSSTTGGLDSGARACRRAGMGPGAAPAAPRCPLGGGVVDDERVGANGLVPFRSPSSRSTKGRGFGGEAGLHPAGA